MRFLLTIALLLVTACSSITFKSGGAIPVSMGHHEDATDFFEIHGERDFYLWGLLTMEGDVYLDQELADRGARQGYILKFGMDRDKAWKTKLLSIISFGMYRPEYYYIWAKGMKSDE